MTGYLRVVREAGVAVVHAPEDEGIVLVEGEDFPGILALADFDLDFGTHGFRGALRRTGETVNQPDCWVESHGSSAWNSANTSSSGRGNRCSPTRE